MLGHLANENLDRLVVEYESGRMTSRAFSAAACELAGIAVPHEVFAAAWCDIFTLNEPVARLAAAFANTTGHGP